MPRAHAGHRGDRRLIPRDAGGDAATAGRALPRILAGGAGRSLGIPARTTGGFQLFGGSPSGHFWAEFYLPDYGWLPVDPTAATMVDYLPDVRPEDKEAFHEFFFGGLDDLRLTMQTDTDLPFVPRAERRTLSTLCVQLPAALCDSMTAFPEAALWEHVTFD